MKKNLRQVFGTTRMSFIVLQAEEKDNLVCAEVGVWIGENAEQMLKIDPNMRLHLIDAYSNVGSTDDLSQGKPEEVKEKARARLDPFKDRITFVYKQSELAYLDYPDGFFDYIYIDGDHSYFGCYRDIKIWWPKVKSGGILAGHDVAMTSVGKAFLDFTIDNGLMHRANTITGNGESDWWIFKP